MELDLKLLVYLDKTQVLADMKNVCKTFLKDLNETTINTFPPLRYLFLVDVMDLLELFPEVGENLIKEPLKWQRYCNDILFACLKSLDNDNEQYVRSSQVAVNIRLKCLPQVLSAYKLRTYEGIVTFNGLLVDVSKPTNYVYHTVWSCSEECEGNEVILQYIPKVPPKCCICGTVLFENSGLRRCGDQVEIVFRVINDLLPKKYNVVDDLIPNLKIGATYVMNAVILKKGTAIWCMEHTTNLSAPVTTPIPADIKKVLRACDSKPWEFIYRLASGIGLNISPSNCFMNVKINLLISLVSIKANIFCNSTILHCLAAGFDSSYIPELMKQASLLASSNIFLGISNSSTSTTLVAASGGVCLMGLPLQTYNQKRMYSVVQAYETGEFNHGLQTVKLKCAIWGYGNHYKNILNDIGNIFGIICRADKGEYNDELVDFILQQAVQPPKITNDMKQSLNDISIYIDLVAGIKVSMDDETEKLIRSYFLAARRERTNVITIANMGALIATCAMSARLCLRSFTNVVDAVFTIWLHICGMSEPRFAPEECLQTPVDLNHLQNILEQFTSWLEDFTDCRIIK